MRVFVILVVGALLAGCNLDAPDPTNISPDPTLGAPTPDPTNRVIGETIPSGTGTCVMTAELGDVPVHASPGEDTPVIATFGQGLSAYTDEFNAGWYSVTWQDGTLENTGWVDADLVVVEGSCPQS